MSVVHTEEHVFFIVLLTHKNSLQGVKQTHTCSLPFLRCSYELFLFGSYVFHVIFPKVSHLVFSVACQPFLCLNSYCYKD